MTTKTNRSAAEVFKQHSQAMIAGELEAIVADYSDTQSRFSVSVSFGPV